MFSPKKFIIYSPELNFKVGGSVVLHKLAMDLCDLGEKALFYTTNGSKYDNIFCSYFANIEDVDDSTVVVYPEIVEGNPLNAKHVVRWVLSDVGVNSSSEIYRTWGAKDLVFHFSIYNPKFDQKSIEVLYTTWIDPAIRNKNLPREGSCYLFKKSLAFHKNINMIHPMDAIMIDQCTNEEIIEIFNRKQFFYSYDPYSFYDIIAMLCGCIPVIYPLAGVSKLEWLKTRASFRLYLDQHNDVPGIAYGVQDIPHALKTISFAEAEQRKILSHGTQSVSNFITRIDDYFFKNVKTYPFRTVEVISKVLGWDMTSRSESKQELEMKELIRLIRHKDMQIESLLHEINFMRSSKFWKLRGLVKKFI